MVKRLPLKEYMMNEHKFTECQMRIIGLALCGLQRKEIADALSLSEATVGSHLDRIGKELKLSGIVRLVVHAILNGFDQNGCYHGEYLYDNYTRLPWEEKKK